MRFSVLITTQKNLLRKALQHKSVNKEYNNERLEFLGDAILNFLTAEQVYLENKLNKEGELSKKEKRLLRENI